MTYSIFAIRRLPLAGGLLTLSTILAGAAHGQALERHVPVTPEGAPAVLAAPNIVPAEQDATPIGPALRAVVLLGPEETVRAAPPAGVTIGAVTRLGNSGAQADLASRLRPFLGQPISRKLIAQIEAAIATLYRDLDYPFLSLSTPGQEISNGDLQIRIVEFTAGNVAVSGATDADSASIIGRIGLRTGEAINARELSDDLDWINLYPFRQVQAVFTPGAALGASDMTLSVAEMRPWRFYGGYGNDGSRDTTLDRYFVGGVLGGRLGQDSVLSVQATASRDVGNDFARYRSVSATYSIPAGVHGLFEASANGVENNYRLDPFTVRLNVSEGSVGYRFDPPGILGDLLRGRAGEAGRNDARLGFEANRQTSSTYFGDLNVYETSMDVYQLYLGLRRTAGYAPGAANWDVSLHLSPGGMGPDNSTDQAALYSQGRIDSMTYGYLDVSYDRLTALPLDLTLKTQIIGKYSSAALPYSEQMGIGGSALVRAYSQDNGAFDSAVVMRNELHTPEVDAIVRVSPYLFVDLGYGRDNASRQDSQLASAGFGTDLRIGPDVTLSLDAAIAMATNGAVKDGDGFVHVSIVDSF